MSIRKARFHVRIIVLVFGVLIGELSLANVLGVNYQNFFPSSSQADYITVHSTEGLRRKKWRAHVYVGVSGNNLLAYDRPATAQQIHTVSDELAAAQIGMAYGITSQLEYGLSLPLHLNHNIRPEADRAYMAQRWGTMVHNQFKYVFARRGAETVFSSGAAVVASLGVPMTREDGFIGQRHTPIVTIEGIYDKGSELESYAFNVGYRIRSPGEPYGDAPVLPLQDQFLFSAAYQKQFEKYPKFNWIAEFYSAYPLDKGLYERAKDISSAEAIFGIRNSPAKSYRWTAGLGTEVIKGTLSPDWRIFSGFSWDFSYARKAKEDDTLFSQRPIHGNADDVADPLDDSRSLPPIIEDGDLDKVPDDDDMCPRTPRGMKVDREGCPFDSDDDSIPNEEDRCPNTPRGEVVNSKGCPALK